MGAVVNAELRLRFNRSRVSSKRSERAAAKDYGGDQGKFTTWSDRLYFREASRH